MKDVFAVFWRLGSVVIFNCEWVLSGKAVVGLSYNVGVTNGPASIPGIKSDRETLDVSKLGTNINRILGLIEEYRKDCLSGTSVVNDLIGEEQVTIIVFLALSFFWFLLPLEQENQSIDRPEDHSKKIG